MICPRPAGKFYDQDGHPNFLHSKTVVFLLYHATSLKSKVQRLYLKLLCEIAPRPIVLFTFWLVFALLNNPPLHFQILLIIINGPFQAIRDPMIFILINDF